MGRIKRGLDYFPMSTSFMHDRMVRRIMRREGDSAFATLVETLSYIYVGKGYYISVGDEFYEELVDSLYSTELDDVKRIISLSVEYGLFDAGLFRQYNILTSADIQRQYLFITKRRSSALIEPEYCLLESEEITSYRSSQSGKSSTDDSLDSECAEAVNGDADHKTACTVTSSSEVTFKNNGILLGRRNFVKPQVICQSPEVTLHTIAWRLQTVNIFLCYSRSTFQIFSSFISSLRRVREVVYFVLIYFYLFSFVLCTRCCNFILHCYRIGA